MPDEKNPPIRYYCTEKLEIGPDGVAPCEKCGKEIGCLDGMGDAEIGERVRKSPGFCGYIRRGGIVASALALGACAQEEKILMGVIAVPPGQQDEGCEEGGYEILPGKPLAPEDEEEKGSGGKF